MVCLSHCFSRVLIAQGACNVDSTDNACGSRTESQFNGASKLDHLKLALTWNRVDVAEEKIFTPDTNWPVSQEIHRLFVCSITIQTGLQRYLSRVVTSRCILETDLMCCCCCCCFSPEAWMM